MSPESDSLLAKLLDKDNWIATVCFIILGIIIFAHLTHFIHRTVRRMNENPKLISYYIECFLMVFTLLVLILWSLGFKLVNEHLTLIEIMEALGIFIFATIVSGIIIWAYSKLPPIEKP